MSEYQPHNDSIYTVYGDHTDPKIHKFYEKTIQVRCPHCKAIHEYIIYVQGITMARVFRSRAIDCDHHCKTCGKSIEPIYYVPCKEEVELKRAASDLRKLGMFTKTRIFSPSNVLVANTQISDVHMQESNNATR
jgi:hypothetical protein